MSIVNIMHYLDIVAPLVPIPMYWTDLEPRVQGANEACIRAMGAHQMNEVVGQTPIDYYPPPIGASIIEHIRLVAETKQTLTQEDVIRDISTGKTRYYAAIRSPLFDENDNVIGVFGISIETTAEKEAERLQQENEAYRIAAEEHEKHRKIADQVVHDIRSPLASMQMILKASEAMPEMERVALRSAATKIGDIANNLLNIYKAKSKKHQPINIEESREPTLISPALLQLLTEKKYQFQASPTKFEHHFTQSGNFAWIHVQPTEFHRSLSNIINNAVDAFDGNAGEVIVYLDADEEKVRVTVEDNGKGMSSELIQKIKDKIAFTEGKTDGHGIGLTQVRDTLQRNEGEMDIESRVGIGTRIILTFPRATAGKWIADRMDLHDDDTIVILDDDSSIHIAWDARFNNLTVAHPNLKIKHFEIGQDAIDFINNFSEEQKRKVFLLSDYELLKQGLTGLDVIERTKMTRSILVTSHYVNKTIRHDAIKVGTQILPKQLAHDIPIHIGQGGAVDLSSTEALTSVDVVFLDDDQNLLLTYDYVYGKQKKIALHHDPGSFFDALPTYPKDTKIMLDYQLDNYHRSGIEIAMHLRAIGFTRLYLMTGMSFTQSDIPNFLTLVNKTDLENVQAILNS